MKTFSVDIETSYGSDCIGCGYGSSDNITIELNKEQAEALADLIDKNEGSIDNTIIEEMIDDGDSTFEDLHEIIVDACIEMDIAYWLETGDSDPAGVLTDQMNKDIQSGEFVPELSFEEFVEDNGYDDEDEDYDEDDARIDYDSELLEDEYIPWLNSLDTFIHAQKVGLDTDTCYTECNYSYTITMD